MLVELGSDNFSPQRFFCRAGLFVPDYACGPFLLPGSPHMGSVALYSPYHCSFPKITFVFMVGGGGGLERVLMLADLNAGCFFFSFVVFSQVLCLKVFASFQKGLSSPSSERRPPFCRVPPSSHRRRY